MLTILEGDALEQLRELPSESVQCCVTSPPYWGLRDYGTAAWEGGDGECNHRKEIKPSSEHVRHEGYNDAFRNQSARANHSEEPHYLLICGKCGAKRIDSQIGLEERPEQYVAKLVEVFREVRRVLKNDGTLWMNLGDSYAAGKQGNDSFGDSSSTLNNGGNGTKTGEKMRACQRKPPQGLKPKDLCGIPWRVAFALQVDGWYLRSDIIWSKPNPMPESVTDRPTKAHEYIFLLSKNEQYFYDAEAIREPAKPWILDRKDGMMAANKCDSDRINGSPNRTTKCYDILKGANKRSVWTVNTAPYPEAHFATYPPDLIKPCILAGTKAGDTILDPFAGSGTTGMVAIEFGRKAVLIELNPGYISLIKTRCNITVGFAF